jgi:hypothetical protein
MPILGHQPRDLGGGFVGDGDGLLAGDAEHGKLLALFPR